MYFVASNGIKTSVILPDIDPMNPRDPDYQDNITKMVCWHNRYNLGDEHKFKSIRDFLTDLAENHVSYPEFFRFVQEGGVWDLCLEEVHPTEPGIGADKPKYMLSCRDADLGEDYWKSTGCLVSEDLQRISGPELNSEGLLDHLNRRELEGLLAASNNVLVKPLYLYDHSGISISTGSFLGRAHHADWDSGQVGYVYMDKNTALENLAGIGDEVYVANPIFTGTPVTLRNPNSQVSRTAEELLSIHDYSQVRPETLHLPADLAQEHPLANLSGDGAWEGKPLYKKDHRLYIAEESENHDAVTLRPIASYNPNLVKLTPETWKTRAEEILQGDVCEYDNYLRNEVYGFQNYEGLEEVDACWGFNPGPEDIKALMAAELSGWYGDEMHYELSYADDFDIERFFKDYDFPDFRDKVRSNVLDYLTHVEQTLDIHPFEMSMADIRSNQEGVLDQVVESLYDEHKLPKGEDILDTLSEHAGVSRSVKPKITVSDLNPDRDYTAEEVLALLNKQPSINDLIKNAEARMAVPQNKEAKGLER